MRMTSLLAPGFALLSPLAALQGADPPKPSARPNIVFILIDDMPWFGTPVRMDADMPASAMAFRNMPNVEKLAAQGMTFRNARAAAGMCAPSRCSIMTGMMTAHHLYSGNGGFGPKTDGNVKYPHYRVSPPCSAIVIGDMKLLHFYEWPDDNFVYDLKTDLGEKKNIATANPERSAQMYQQMMERLKAVGGYFPKPNPNADPMTRRYDPNDLSDQGEGSPPLTPARRPVPEPRAKIKFQ